VLVTAVLCFLATSAAGGLARASAAFEVGALPPAPGLGLTRNDDVEPGIAASPDGRVWVAAFDWLDQRRGLAGLVSPQSDPLIHFGAIDLWRSDNAGRTYSWAGEPFNPVAGHLGLNGGDVDIAVARTKNSRGFYNIYLATLWVLGNDPAENMDIAMAVSQDAIGSLTRSQRRCQTTTDHG
jgi:hypothetical protein